MLNNKLAAGVLICGRFRPHAASRRVDLTHNVMTDLKRRALPQESSSARPKRLRFLTRHYASSNMPGKRRRTWLRY